MFVCVCVCVTEEEIVEVKIEGSFEIVIIFSTLLRFLFESNQIKVLYFR